MSGFRSRVLSGELLLGAFLGLGSPAVAEILGTAGFDWLVVDLEHGFGDALHSFEEIGAILSAGVAAFVRVPSADATAISKALDNGATGVIVPRIRTIGEAQEAARAARYSSGRGISTMTRALGWGTAGADTLAHKDAEVVVAVQIETREALLAVDEIASSEGIDCLFLGPTDLAWALGLDGGPDSTALLQAAERVARAARKAGKGAGVAVGSPIIARLYRDRGYSLISCASDMGFIQSGALGTTTKLRAGLIS